MKISAGTIARTIWLCLALINQCLVLSGREVLPFAENEVYEVVSLIFTISASLVAWWKNNSFTKKAIIADSIMKEGA